MDIGWITAAPNDELPATDASRVAFSLEDADHASYAELYTLQNRYANGLRQLGVHAGDRVGVLLLNGVDYVALYFAIARLGAIAVRLNTRLGPDELTFVLGDSGARVLCLDASLADPVASIRAKIPVTEFVLFGEPAFPIDWARLSSELHHASSEEPEVERPQGPEPVMLMYTSGTTGPPKGVIWTHETTLGCITSQALELGMGPDTVAMATGPMYHAGSFEALLLPTLLRQGRGVITRSGGFDIARIVKIVASEGVTDLFLHPVMIYDLLRMQPAIDAGQLPSLRSIFTGGDPIMTWALQQIQERFPALELRQGYGLTEATQSTYLSHDACVRHPDSVGRPFPLKEVEVMEEDGTPAADGTIGEVLVRGAGVAAGYWQRPQETTASFDADGWLHTGDLGRIEDGLLFLAGRKKDLIRSGGENISPAEVEIVLTGHAEILDAAVVAIPDAKYLEVGCAVVVVAEQAVVSDEQIIAYCRAHLAGYKCPRHVVRVDTLPRNSGGKVLKAELRERYRSLGQEPLSR